MQADSLSVKEFLSYGGKWTANRAVDKGRRHPFGALRVHCNLIVDGSSSDKADALSNAHPRVEALVSLDPVGLIDLSRIKGAAKRQLHTRRPNYIHALRCVRVGVLVLKQHASILAAVPLFHARGWAPLLRATAVGANLRLWRSSTDGVGLALLIREEAIVSAVGVKTQWQRLVGHIASQGGTAATLKRALTGGSNRPASLKEKLGICLRAPVQATWGMRERSSLGRLARRRARKHSIAFGRAADGVDPKLAPVVGRTLPEQHNVVGGLNASGSRVVDRGVTAAVTSCDRDGSIAAGDLAKIYDASILATTGRAKDLIKSSGKWINLVKIEAMIGRPPCVSQVTVVGRHGPDRDDCPVLIGKARGGYEMDAGALWSARRGEVADRWCPDRLNCVGNIPLAAAGKIDKNRVREEYGGV